MVIWLLLLRFQLNHVEGGYVDKKEEILAHLSVEDVFGSKLKRTSKRFSMVCPFHDDKAPSLHINRETMIFHCFGCGTSGSAFDFVMKKEGIDFHEALKVLADKAGVALDEGHRPHARLYEINKAAMNLYIERLHKSPAALKYLMEERGLTQESIDRFRIGYASGSVISALKNMGFTNDEIVESGVGVIKDGVLKSFFFDRILFPIMSGGRVLGFGGRLFGNKPSGEYKPPKYLNSASSPIFQKKSTLYGLDKSAIKESGSAIVVEGYLDVIMCHQRGYRNTVAPLGTAFSEEHADLLQTVTETIVPVFDGDMAGQKAAEISVKLLFDKKLKGSVVTLPDGEDPDSYLRKGGNLDLLIAEGLSFGCFLGDRFPATRNMLFTAMLFRSSREAAEYVGHMGSRNDAETLMQLNARKLIQEMVRKAPVIAFNNKVEVRKYSGFLILLSKSRFIMWEPIGDWDPKKKAEGMLASFLEIKRKYFSRNGTTKKRSPTTASASA